MSIKTPEIFCKPTGGKVVSGVYLAILMVFVLTVNLRMQVFKVSARSAVTKKIHVGSIHHNSQLCSAFIFASLSRAIPCIWLSWFRNVDTVDTLNSRTRSQSIVVFYFFTNIWSFWPWAVCMTTHTKTGNPPGYQCFSWSFPQNTEIAPKFGFSYYWRLPCVVP